MADNVVPDLIEHVERDGVAGLKLNFHYGQLEAWKSTARIVAVLAGSQGGKTAFGPIWMHREMQRKGPGDYIAATSSYDLFHLKMLPAMQEYFEGTLGIGRYWSGDRIIEIADPTTGQFLAKKGTDRMYQRIVLRSAQSKGGLESLTGLAAWLDEAGQDEFEYGSYEAVRRRLTLAEGRILITTTPYNLGWLKQQVVDKADGKYIHLINFPSTANPRFSAAEYEQLKSEMQDWRFAMFHEGKFSRPPGMIYKDFIDKYIWEVDENGKSGHKVESFKIPPSWPVFVGVDPGGVHLAKIWLARDPKSDIYYLFNESIEGDKSTREHATDAKLLAAQNRWDVKLWTIGQRSEGQVRKDWIEAGVKPVAQPPIHDVESGIDKVVQLFKDYRLFVFDNCAGTLDQLARYSRDVDALGNVSEKIKNKEQFHFLDGTRYDVVGAEHGRGPVKVKKQPKALEEYRG